MTQHNRPHSPKRVVLTLDSRTTVITSDKTLMMAMNGFKPAYLRLHRSPHWRQYATEIAPAVGVTTPTEGPQAPATDACRPAEQWAWWEKIPARTAAVASIAVVVAAVGSALIARGAAR